MTKTPVDQVWHTWNNMINGSLLQWFSKKKRNCNLWWVLSWVKKRLKDKRLWIWTRSSWFIFDIFSVKEKINQVISFFAWSTAGKTGQAFPYFQCVQTSKDLAAWVNALFEELSCLNYQYYAWHIQNFLHLPPQSLHITSTVSTWLTRYLWALIIDLLNVFSEVACCSEPIDSILSLLISSYVSFESVPFFFLPFSLPG